MTNVTIRPVRESDTADWLAMRAALWPNEADEHERHVAAYFVAPPADAPTLIARTADGRAAGFAELSVRSCAEGCTTSAVAYLEGWFVRADCRREGVGRALINAAEAWARGRGLTEFASDAEIHNDTSRLAHEGLGFEEVAAVRCFRKPLTAG